VIWQCLEMWLCIATFRHVRGGKESNFSLDVRHIYASHVPWEQGCMAAQYGCAVRV
jgi:hypothetical protein